jgi:hypothetical protein
MDNSAMAQVNTRLPLGTNASAIWLVLLRWGTGASRDALPRSVKFVDDACALEVAAEPVAAVPSA